MDRVLYGKKDCLFVVLFLLFFSFFTPNRSWAKKIQILHVNDLHGFFENTGKDKSLGGYGALKALIDEYKEKGAEQGMESLVFNAGDFMEGQISYTAKEGYFNFEAMNIFNFDAVTIGNHDWFMGQQNLNNLLENVQTNFPLLGANFKASDLYPGIKKNVRPYIVKKIEGLHIAILGLTTDEPFYKWLVPELTLESPITVAQSLIPYIQKKERPDALIVLSHIGVNKDSELAQNTTGVDLIVGGHSHTALHEVLWKKNVSGHLTPIVQSGMHGNYLGRLVIDVVPGKRSKVVSYELIKVQNPQLTSDFEPIISQMQKEVEHIYGSEWLEEVIGEAHVDLLNSSKESTRWGRFIADATKESVDADVGIHVAEFSGQEFRPGRINHRDIFNSYPRIFDFKNNPFGWRVWSADMYGLFLKWAVRICMLTGYSLEISGLTFDVERKLGGLWWAYNFRVNGKKLRLWRHYRLAVPEGLITGGMSIAKKLAEIIFNNPNEYELSIQEAIAFKLKKETIINDDQEDQKLNLENPKRMMIPSFNLRN